MSANAPAWSPLELQDRFRGAFLGYAIGDALGFPLRGVPGASLRQLPGLGEDFAARPRGKFAKGQFSDDTQVMLATAESVALEKRVDGRSIGAHIAWTWKEGVLLQPPLPLSEAAERLARGMPWLGAGAPSGVRCHSAVGRGLVVGLVQPEVLGRLPHDAGVAAMPTHRDPSCAAACAAFARAISLGLEKASRTPAAFCEALAVAAGMHDAGLAEELRALPRLLDWELDRALALLRRVGVSAAEAEATDGVLPHAWPVLLTGLYCALRLPHDFREAVTAVLRLGGEVDATAAITGGLLGAHLGSSAIPARLRRNVLYGTHLMECADRVFAVRTHGATEAIAALSRRR